MTKESDVNLITKEVKQLQFHLWAGSHSNFVSLNKSSTLIIFFHQRFMWSISIGISAIRFVGSLNCLLHIIFESDSKPFFHYIDSWFDS
ncbi:MAG: hypothetical protein CM15mP22_1390 [Gammaproteobacteria bacterium]|nr:MAG: hypothetical protein CM15mP22_1390 [Gammaproteobacteria bacterium]